MISCVDLCESSFWALFADSYLACSSVKSALRFEILFSSYPSYSCCWLDYFFIDIESFSLLATRWIVSSDFYLISCRPFWTSWTLKLKSFCKFVNSTMSAWSIYSASNLASSYAVFTCLLKSLLTFSNSFENLSVEMKSALF